MSAPIKIIISVDWEGSNQLSENMNPMRAFREKHPDVSMQHFLNTAYCYIDGKEQAP